MGRETIRFKYLYQHEDTGTMFSRFFTLADIESGANKRVLRDCPRHYLVDRLQSTGLFDRNGLEIFEDDIVETSYSRGHEPRHAFQVEWNEESGQWVFTPFEVGNFDAPLLGIEEFSHSWDDGFSGGNAEVIGTIHQNQELLTK